MKHKQWNYRFWSFFYFAIAMLMAIGTAVSLLENRDYLGEIKKLQEKIDAKDGQIGELIKLKSHPDGLAMFKVMIYDERDSKMCKILESIYHHSTRTGVSPFLGYRVMMHESKGDPLATSATGDYGLMQVNYAVHRVALSIDFGRILEIDYNIGLGMDVLKDCLLRAGGDADRALRMYNGLGKGGDPNYQGNVIGGAHAR